MNLPALTGGIALALLLALGGVLESHTRTLTIEPATTLERIEEDDPRWDCATMGNRVCGPAPIHPALDAGRVQ